MPSPAAAPVMAAAPVITTIPAPAPAPIVPPVPVAAPFPAAAVPATGFAQAEPLTDGALAKAPEPVLAGAADSEALRSAVVAALDSAGHKSASELLRAASFTLDGGSVRIEVPGIGKKMLALTVNAAAEKIIRQELQRLSAPSRFLVVPGAGAAPSAESGSAAPSAGSVEEAALGHPLVSKAREIFHAEVRSIVDLRRK